MPSPSKAKLFSGLAVTAVFFAVGAYAASAVGGDVKADSDPVLRGGYTAAPVPRAIDPRAKTVVPQAESQKTKTVEQQQPIITDPTPVVEESEPAIKEALSVSITDIRSDYGNVIVMVFPDAQSYNSFDYSKAVGYAELKAKAGTLTTAFPELNDGPYVVSLFHDENGDQQFNMSGEYPIEGYGTSNAKSKYDELSFKKASVMAGSITVKMHYLE